MPQEDLIEKLEEEINILTKAIQKEIETIITPQPLAPERPMCEPPEFAIAEKERRLKSLVEMQKHLEKHVTRIKEGED